jgi:LysM repeat protein
MAGRRTGRRASASASTVVVLLIVGACGSAGQGTTPTRETPLPPLPTVTTTTTPTTTLPAFYVVQRGDTLTSIAKRFRLSIAALVAANHLANPDKVLAGQRLALPRPPPKPVPSTTVVAPPP